MYVSIIESKRCLIEWGKSVNIWSEYLLNLLCGKISIKRCIYE